MIWIYTTILPLLWICCKAVMDAINFHDSFTKMGWPYYWSYAAFTAPKKNWFQKYFPMFHDAWHLFTAIQVYVVSLYAATFIQMQFGPAHTGLELICYSVVIYLILSWIFNLEFEELPS